MDDIIMNDYASWRIEKDTFLDRVKKSALLERIADVIKVTDFLYEKSLEKPLDSDEQDIFQTGFLFLNDQISTLQMYLSTYFDDDVNEFMKFDNLINLVLYIEDFSEELYQFTNDSEHLEMFTDLEDELDEMIQNRVLDYKILDRFNKKSEKVSRELDFEYTGILEVFTRVCEHYSLYENLEK